MSSSRSTGGLSHMLDDQSRAPRNIIKIERCSAIISRKAKQFLDDWQDTTVGREREAGFGCGKLTPVGHERHYGVDSGEQHRHTFCRMSDQPGSSPALEEQQEGLPEEIKLKTYPSSNLVSAEEELFEDLKKHCLLDSDKFIVINEEGKDGRCRLEEENPLLVQADIPLLVDKKTKRCRHPDVSIWGAGRLEVEEDDDFDQNWTKKIENELWKLQEQMTDYIKDLGTVNLGFLIKAIPVKEKKCPSLEDRSVPLAGFDVYCFRPWETADTTPEPILKYRVGTNEATSMVIEISGRYISRRNPEEAEAVRIPLSVIRRVCEKWGVKFEAEAAT
eukprot:scaffold66660_cov58-Attheya_sp.AAC.2